MLVNPDELFQGTQIAYDIVYGGVDLPWEWREPYKIRNALYPIYLSWPLFVLKKLKIDYRDLVLASPYIAHFPLMVLCDHFLWKVGKDVVGKPATRIAFILMLTNTFMMEYDIRCFTNTLEKICTVIAYSYYLKVGSQFNHNTIIFTALLTLSFLMRNTSPVGWIPLLFLKIFRDGAFLPFLIAGVVIALPMLYAGVYLDSLYYSHGGKFEWTFTSWNFIQINVLQGLSKYFGDHQLTEYIFNFLPKDIFKATTPFLVHGLYKFTSDMRNKNKSTEMAIMCGFYIAFFSLIGHKENRFMLPILPFLFLFTGYSLTKCPNSLRTVIKVALWIFVIEGVGMFIIRQQFHHRFWDAPDYIMNYGDKQPHSLYTMHRFETPYYSWLHSQDQNRTELYVVQQGPSFARKAFGAPL
jgi:phosphatidylinositol glycan class B